MDRPITLYYDNSAVVANTMKSKNHKRTKHIDKKYQIIRKLVMVRVVDVSKITCKDKLADPFTKTLVARSFERHVEGMGM